MSNNRTIWKMKLHDGDEKPNPGRYLALVFEWAGPVKYKPKKPKWVIKHVWQEGVWEQEDVTGNCLEVVNWMELPPTSLRRRRIKGNHNKTTTP